MQALREVTLTVEEGEIVSLVGANGAGKSTLLYAIAGALPSSGHIAYRGETLNGTAPDRVARLGIGLVPEGRQIFGTLTVLDNLCWVPMSTIPAGGAICWEAFSASPTRTKCAIGWPPSTTSSPSSRSARIRRAAVSAAASSRCWLSAVRLMARPDLLLVDELSMGLAPNLVRQLLGLLGRLREMGLTILLVEQDARAALRVADRAMSWRQGASWPKEQQENC